MYFPQQPISQSNVFTNYTIIFFTLTIYIYMSNSTVPPQKKGGYGTH